MAVGSLGEEGRQSEEELAPPVVEVARAIEVGTLAQHGARGEQRHEQGEAQQAATHAPLQHLAQAGEGEGRQGRHLGAHARGPRGLGCDARVEVRAAHEERVEDAAGRGQGHAGLERRGEDGGLGPAEAEPRAVEQQRAEVPELGREEGRELAAHLRREDLEGAPVGQEQPQRVEPLDDEECDHREAGTPQVEVPRARHEPGQQGRDRGVARGLGGLHGDALEG